MATILKGLPVAEVLQKKMQRDVEELKTKGLSPTLCILRVGERPDDLSYEKGAVRRAESVGVKVVKKILPIDVTQKEFDTCLEEINQDTNIHGILMFRPLPNQLDDEKARMNLNPNKDVDGCTNESLAGVFANDSLQIKSQG